MADGRHIENRILAIYCISAIYCSINAKFGTLYHNHVKAQVK